jgi:hypothetical protein
MFYLVCYKPSNLEASFLICLVEFMQLGLVIKETLQQFSC